MCHPHSLDIHHLPFRQNNRHLVFLVDNGLLDFLLKFGVPRDWLAYLERQMLPCDSKKWLLISYTDKY